MDTKHTLACVGLALVVACGGDPAVRLNESPDVPATRWQGNVSSPPTLDGAVEMVGTAWMAEAQDEEDATVVEVAIRNAAPGGVHPWEVRQGQCGTNAMPFGDSLSYEPLEVGNDGRARATVMVDEPLPERGEHSVTILASPQNRDLIVACANLAPPVASGFR